MQYTQPLQAGLNCVAPPALKLGRPNVRRLTQSSAGEGKARELTQTRGERREIVEKKAKRTPEKKEERRSAPLLQD